MLAAGLAAFHFAASPAAAETCSTRVINGEQVVLCCDGNGVCYRK